MVAPQVGITNVMPEVRVAESLEGLPVLTSILT